MTRSETALWIIAILLILITAVVILPMLSTVWADTVYRFKDAQIQVCLNNGQYSLDQCIRIVGAR